MIIDQSEGFPTRVDYPPEFVDSLNRPDKNDCFDRVLDDEGPDFGCFLGAKKDRLDFVFFGDSHSLSLKTIVDELANIHGVSVFYIGASGCIPFLNIYLDRSDQLGNDCFKLNQRVAEFAEDKNIRGIILSAKWSYYTNGYYDGSRVQLISESKTVSFLMSFIIIFFISKLLSLLNF